MSAVALIANPRSHSVSRRGALLERVARRNPGAPFLKVDDFSALPRQIGELARHGARTLFVEGGDGTLRAVMSASLNAKSHFQTPPDFAILPGGSTNLAYKILGLKDLGEQAMQTRIADLETRRIPQRRTTCPALMLRSSARSNPLVGFLLSTGSLARAMEYCQHNIHGDGPRGSLAVAATIARLVARPRATLGRGGKPVLQGSLLELEADDHKIDGAHAFSMMTTLPRLNLGLQPFWDRQGHDIAVTHARWPVWRIRFAAMKILLAMAGPNLSRHGLTSFGVNEISFRHGGDVMMDGEMLARPPDDWFHLSVTPQLGFLR